MTTNQELIEKAIITTDALAAGGKLPPKQADKFIDYVIDVTMLKGNARIVRFKNESMQIDKIGVGSRVTVPKAEAVAPSVRRGVTTSKVTITPKDLMTPFEISDNFPDQCIEGESVENTIMRLMATQTANDIEELLINGDTLGHARLESDLIEGGSSGYIVDPLMKLFNGWLRLADSGNIYDAAGADISSIIFSRMINKMPNKFRRIRANLRFLASLDHEQLYREKVSARATGAGDAALSSSGPLRPYGVPLIGVPLLESECMVVEHLVFGAAPDTQYTRYAPIGTTLIITPSTLGSTPVTPYAETTDYTVNRTTGAITTVNDMGMETAGTYKVTYYSRGQMLLTEFQNLIFAIGRDISIEKDRDIYKAVTQFAISTRVSCEIEEVTALVKGINVGLN